MWYRAILDRVISIANNAKTGQSASPSVCLFRTIMTARRTLRPVSIFHGASYDKISRKVKLQRLIVNLLVSLWNLTDGSAAMLPSRLSNFRAIGKLQTLISCLRDFARSYDKMSYHVLKPDPIVVARGSWQDSPCQTIVRGQFAEATELKCSRGIGRVAYPIISGMLFMLAYWFWAYFCKGVIAIGMPMRVWGT